MEAEVEIVDEEDTKAVAAVVVEVLVDAVEATKVEVPAIITPDTTQTIITIAPHTSLNNRMYPNRTRRTCNTMVLNILEVTMAKPNKGATTINLSNKHRNCTWRCISNSLTIDNGVTLHKMINIITMR